MTIKYEPVFGDQSLFDDAHKTHIWAVHNNGTILTSEKPGGLMPGIIREDFSMAMRRVIKTPTWTRADQEAGVLPPVGAEVIYTPIDKLHRTKITEQWAVGTVLECIALAFVKGKELAVMYDAETQTVSPLLSEAYSPIETPEEKAQREQDEFLESLHYSKSTHPSSFYKGALAAYMKLKAPTNE